MEIGDVAVAEEDPGDVETSGGEEGDAAWTTEGARGAAEGGSKNKQIPCYAVLIGADTLHFFIGKVTTIVTSSN